MDLRTLQCSLLGLIKGAHSVTEDDDAYLRAVAISEHLEMVREVVHWWRAFGVARFCVLTSALLKQRGRFDDAIADFVRTRGISPFVEELGPRFLETAGRDRDPVVAALARFEFALIRVKSGDSTRHVIEWPCDPRIVLESVLGGSRPIPETTSGAYRTVVSRELPDLFQVIPGV